MLFIGKSYQPFTVTDHCQDGLRLNFSIASLLDGETSSHFMHVQILILPCGEVYTFQDALIFCTCVSIFALQHVRFLAARTI